MESLHRRVAESAMEPSYLCFRKVARIDFTRGGVQQLAVLIHQQPWVSPLSYSQVPLAPLNQDVP